MCFVQAWNMELEAMAKADKYHIITREHDEIRLINLSKAFKFSIVQLQRRPTHNIQPL